MLFLISLSVNKFPARFAIPSLLWKGFMTKFSSFGLNIARPGKLTCPGYQEFVP